ncbi:unnamed protein product [Symbiodinium sp. CCMP2456]|nr:unnamed protein product [Symbiodinium sp. CCMP2456]
MARRSSRCSPSGSGREYARIVSSWSLFCKKVRTHAGAHEPASRPGYRFLDCPDGLKLRISVQQVS